MKSHTFTVAIPEGTTPTDIISLVKKQFKGFSGDERYGSFNDSGLVGSYECDGENICITLTRKPFFLKWSYIESEIRQRLA